MQEGLRRLFLLRLPDKVTLKLEGNPAGDPNAFRPDLVAVLLPKDHVGRTFADLGKMVDPEPIKMAPLIVFSTLNQQKSPMIVRVLYDLPQPPWVSRGTEFGIKIAGMLLAALLLSLNSPDKVNPERYKKVLIGAGALYVLAYGILIYVALRYDGDLGAIVENLVFAGLTAVAALVTYWVTRKAATTGGQIPEEKKAMV